MIESNEEMMGENNHNYANNKNDETQMEDESKLSDTDEEVLENTRVMEIFQGNQTIKLL